MSTRTVVRNCYIPTDHAIHVSDPRRSMYEVEEDLVRYLCPGGRAGDKRIRDADDIAALADEVAREQAAIPEAPPEDSAPRRVEYDDEPDGHDPLEDYSEADLEYEADRAADRYERWLDRDN